MQGQLFTQDFLTRGILETPPHKALTEADFTAFRHSLQSIFAAFDSHSTINEAQTEALVINKLLVALGWGDDTLPQVNSDPEGPEAVPDCLLFANPDKKALAVNETRDDRRYRHGLAILEAKRWLRPLDRGDGKEVHDPDAPSSQMLRYLSRVDVASDRAVKWGMLTNGAVWRLYWQDARSRAEEFFEVDVAAALGVPGVLYEPEEIPPDRALRLFFLFFHRGEWPPPQPHSCGLRDPAGPAADLHGPRHGRIRARPRLRGRSRTGPAPLTWNEEDRRSRLAALDALFFHLYGLDASDAAHILDTFPIVREQDEKAFGRYRTKEDVLMRLTDLAG